MEEINKPANVVTLYEEFGEISRIILFPKSPTNRLPFRGLTSRPKGLYEKGKSD